MLNSPTRGAHLLLSIAVLLLACNQSGVTPRSSSTTNPTSTADGGLGSSCEATFTAPGASCQFLLKGSELAISGEAHSDSASTEARVRVDVEMDGAPQEDWNCQGTTETSPPGDGTPGPGETWSFCGWDLDVPTSLTGRVATCRVQGQPEGRFSCHTIP